MARSNPVQLKNISSDSHFTGVTFYADWLVQLGVVGKEDVERRFAKECGKNDWVQDYYLLVLIESVRIIVCLCGVSVSCSKASVQPQYFRNPQRNA
jgi:hypothetical protein